MGEMDGFKKLLNIYSYALKSDEFYLIRKSTGEIIDTFSGGRIIYKRRRGGNNNMEYSITGKKFYRIYFDALDGLDLTSNDFKILLYLAKYTRFASGEIMNQLKKPIKIKHIVDNLKISRSSATRSLDKLEKLDIIKKCDNMYYMNPFIINKTHKISGKLCNMFKDTKYAEEFEVAEIKDVSKDDIEI